MNQFLGWMGVETYLLPFQVPHVAPDKERCGDGTKGGSRKTPTCVCLRKLLLLSLSILFPFNANHFPGECVHIKLYFNEYGLNICLYIVYTLCRLRVMLNSYFYSTY